jgi:hypothetical protein
MVLSLKKHRDSFTFTLPFTKVSRRTLGLTQPPIQWVSGAISLGVKRPGGEADHSPPTSAKNKNAWSYTSTPQYAFMAWCSIKAQGQIYLYFNLTLEYWGTITQLISSKSTT